MYLSDNNGFGELGYWQFVIGALQTIGYGTAVGLKHSEQERYLSRLKRTQQTSHQSQLDLKQKELSTREQLLQQQGSTELYADERLKKLVTISIVVFIAISIIGIATYYVLSIGE